MGWRVCSTPGCPEIHDGTGRCPDCRRGADRDRTSGAAKYGKGHRERFRPGVLAKNGGLCAEDGCAEPATVADHWPLDRVELVERGLDPDDPKHGRPLCKPHHDRHTGLTTGGFQS